MRETDGVAGHPSADAPRRRRTLVVAMLATVAAAGALTAVAGPALAMRPVISAAGAHSGSPATPSGPSATAAPIALDLASVTATGDATPPATPTPTPPTPPHGTPAPA